MIKITKKSSSAASRILLHLHQSELEGVFSVQPPNVVCLLQDPHIKTGQNTLPCNIMYASWSFGLFSGSIFCLYWKAATKVSSWTLTGDVAAGKCTYVVISRYHSATAQLFCVSFSCHSNLKCVSLSTKKTQLSKICEAPKTVLIEIFCGFLVRA